MKKTTAIVEVLLVLFLALALFRWPWPVALADWQRRLAGLRLVEYAFLLVLAATVVTLRRVTLAEGGLRLGPTRAEARLAVGGILPVLAIGLALSRLGWSTWGRAALVSALILAALALLAWLSRDRTTAEPASTRLALLLPGLLLTGAPSVPLRLLGTFLLVAPAEELLFRGYVQSRLNAALGRPRVFLGVSWGWGLILTSLLFGLWHVLNPLNPWQGQWGLAWTWGLWTTCLGLLLGWTREKTGGLLAPWLWHGLINL